MILQLAQFFKAQKKHFWVIGGFLGLALLLFFPVMQGKALYQSDIAQYKAMAHSRDQARESGVESYWTQSAFGGMPTYQLGAHYAYNMMRTIDKGIRFLPRPTDYVFLYLLSAYLLLLMLGIDYRAAALGAVGFALATYHIIILDVGHNAKAHAIGYFPLVLAAAYGLFRKKRYALYTLALALFVGLEIYANHYQMTYYLFLFMGILWLVEGVKALKETNASLFLKRTVLLALAILWGIALNATSLFATKEYAEFSTRGESSIQTEPDGTPKSRTSGLSLDYITQYSYGIGESFNLLIPRYVGGSNAEPVGEDSKVYDFLRANNVPRAAAVDFVNRLPLYWGEQPIVAAPAYLGVVIGVLALMGFFYLNGLGRITIGFSFLLFLALSWGKNFMPLTELMVNYLPFYNKFRAVSSIQVILSLMVPVLAAHGVYRFYRDPNRKQLSYTAIALGAVFIAAIIASLFTGFSGGSDPFYAENYSQEFLNALIEDRKRLFYNDLIRTLIFGLLTLSVLWFYERINKYSVSFFALIMLVLIDLGGVAKRYIRADDFVSARQIEKPFSASAVDAELLKDTTYYKVFNLNEGLNGARTSYFHRSLGGYHAAKPAFIQNITDYLIYRDRPEVLDMLNVKYLITTDQSGEESIMPYTSSLGPAWFVESTTGVESEEEALLGLKTLNYKSEALVLEAPSAVLSNYSSSEADYIEIIQANEGDISFQYNAERARFAVFSEWFYTPNPSDWKLEVDGELTAIYQTNYALIGAVLKPGAHQVRLYFDPEVVQKADLFRLPAQILFIVALLFIPLYEWRRS
ncbi:MAG: hypothetical protein ACO3PP_04685 [Flavobacteriaceae bacterium]